MQAKFLNVDLDIITTTQPINLLRNFGDKVYALHSEPDKDGKFSTRLEVAFGIYDALTIMQTFDQLIKKLSEEGKKEWKEAESKIFDLGYDISPKQFYNFTHIDPTILQIIQTHGAQLKVTMYNSEESNVSVICKK